MTKFYSQELTFKEIQERCAGAWYFGKEKSAIPYEKLTFKDADELRKLRGTAIVRVNTLGLVDGVGNPLDDYSGMTIVDYEKLLSPSTKIVVVFEKKEVIENYIEEQFDTLYRQFPVLVKEEGVL